MLLRAASRAISAHAAAVSLVAEATSLSESPETRDRLVAAARATCRARESAVERYENHRSAHELKVMTAGFGFPE